MAGRSRGRVRGAGAALLVAGCCLAPATAASGSVGSAHFTLNSDEQVGTAVAHCPGKQRATGGGFSATPPVTMSNYTTTKVFVSKKVGQRGWRVSAQETTFPAALTVTVRAYVYCSKHAGRTTAAAHSVPILAGVSGFTVSDARCASGTAQAGGFSFSTPNFDGGLIASQRHGKHGWRTRVDSDRGVTATTYAYCAQLPAPRARSGSLGVTGNLFGTATSEPCPRGLPPLSGGFAQPDAITGFAGNDYRNFTPYESKRSGKQWESAGDHGGLTTSHLVSIAYCR